MVIVHRKYAKMLENLIKLVGVLVRPSLHCVLVLVPSSLGHILSQEGTLVFYADYYSVEKFITNFTCDFQWKSTCFNSYFVRTSVAFGEDMEGIHIFAEDCEWLVLCLLLHSLPASYPLESLERDKNSIYGFGDLSKPDTHHSLPLTFKLPFAPSCFKIQKKFDTP